MGMKKIILKIIPYIASLLSGSLFFIISQYFESNLKNLLINISAAFFAIPFLYLFYQLTKEVSKKKLNKEIFDYAKMQIDSEILSILNHLMRMVYSLEKADYSLDGIGNFLSYKRDDIKLKILNNKYLGFQIFKTWKVKEDNLHEILKNPYILNKLKDEEIISIILLIKNLRYLQGFSGIDDLYIKTGKKSKSYKIKHGLEINSENKKFENRYILLKKLGKGGFRVSGFGDFSKYDADKLLFEYKVNENYTEELVDAIYDLIKEINKWLNLTGKEFLIDTTVFRIARKTTYMRQKISFD